jgi:polysaccharide biosynthesis protein PelA
MICREPRSGMIVQLLRRLARALRNEHGIIMSEQSKRSSETIQATTCDRAWIAKYRRRFLVTFLAFIALACLGGGRGSQARDNVKFLINYGTTVGDRIGKYDVVVLEADVAASTIAKRHPDGVILGYLSLGEVHSGRDYFAEAAGFVLRPNPNWPEARFIDMRDRRWHKMVIERLVPEILAKGFNGLFFDTLDDAEFLEAQDPVRFAGMVDAAADLLRGIRQHFPGVPLMVNRGYAVVQRAPGSFDMLLGESVFTTFDAASGAYRLLSEADYHWQIERMRDAQRRDPKLRLFSLDYWNPDDARGIARIYAEQRTNGFVPYVGTPDLTRIVSEP